MKTKIAFLFLAVWMTHAPGVFAGPDPNFYIYLCFGQSNMEGGGRIQEEDRTVDKRFQVLADFDVPRRDWKKGEWYAAIPPLCRPGIVNSDCFRLTSPRNRLTLSRTPPAALASN